MWETTGEEVAISQHICILPAMLDPQDATIGDGAIWKCDECGTRYQLTISRRADAEAEDWSFAIMPTEPVTPQEDPVEP